MATRVEQFRYYAQGNDNNYPSNWAWPAYCTVQTFRDKSPIYQLGIQTLPGTKLYINSSITPIVIGSSGIFELNVTDTSASITSFRIEQESMKRIDEEKNGYLIIDMVHGEQEDD